MFPAGLKSFGDSGNGNGNTRIVRIARIGTEQREQQVHGRPQPLTLLCANPSTPNNPCKQLLLQLYFTLASPHYTPGRS
jgi:hypothetical protein